MKIIIFIQGIATRHPGNRAAKTSWVYLVASHSSDCYSPSSVSSISRRDSTMAV